MLPEYVQTLITKSLYHDIEPSEGPVKLWKEEEKDRGLALFIMSDGERNVWRKRRIPSPIS